MLRVGAVIVLLASCVIQQPGGTTPPPSSPPPPAPPGQPQPTAQTYDPDGESAPAPAPAPPPRGDDRVVARMNDAAMVRVPDVQHRSLADAQQALRAAGLTGELHVAWTDDIPHGNQWLCGTQPSTGQEVRADFDIEIDFCRPENQPEPKLIGASEAEARRAIGELMAKVYPASTYRIEIATDRASSSCAAGTVCGIEPRRWYANPTDVITIHVAN
jgi:hypothetical protein